MEASQHPAGVGVYMVATHAASVKISATGRPLSEAARLNPACVDGRAVTEQHSPLPHHGASEVMEGLISAK